MDYVRLKTFQEPDLQLNPKFDMMKNLQVYVGFFLLVIGGEVI